MSFFPIYHLPSAFYFLMKIDLHCHSKYSFDSKMETDTILETAKERGLDAIAITDHGSIEGGVEASKIQEKHGIKVIVGQETHSDIGDIIGLFINEPIKGKKWEEIVDQIRKQNGLVMLPHPLVAMAFNHDSFLKNADFIEGFNPRYTRLKEVTNGHGEPSVHHLAEVYKLRVVANSDSHEYKSIGTVYTEIQGEVKDIKKALLKQELKIFGTTKTKYPSSV